MQNNVNAPCYGCGRRHQACHSSCEIYLGWKAQRAEIAKERRAKRDALTTSEGKKKVLARWMKTNRALKMRKR